MLRIALIALLMLFSASCASYAATCDDSARKLADRVSGKVVSVRVVGTRCEVKLLVPSGDGPPMMKTYKIRK